MAKKYFTTRAMGEGEFFHEGESLDMLARTIFEKESVTVNTGLVDQYGSPIMSVIETDPIGFIRHESES